MLPSAMLLWLIVIAIMDFRLRKVRNWMVVIGLAIGLLAVLVHAQSHVDWLAGAADKLGGLALAFAVLLPFYVIRWMGAGDVKFAAVMGLWFGCSWELLYIWLGASLLAGLHSLLLLTWPHVQQHLYSFGIQIPQSWVRASVNTQSAKQAPGPSSSLAIQRSIPYAGYMALIAIWFLVHRSSS